MTVHTCRGWVGCGGAEFNGGDVDVTQILATAAEVDFVDARRL